MDVLAAAAPTRICSTNPLERHNRELARRNDGVGSFPNRGPLPGQGTAILVEQHDEWLAVGKRDRLRSR